MSNLKIRIISALVLTLVLVAALCFHNYVFEPFIVLTMVYMTFEALHAFGEKKSFVVLGMLFSLGYGSLLYFDMPLLFVAAEIFVYVVLNAFFALKNCDEVHFDGIAIISFTTLYINLCLGTLLLIHKIEGVNLYLILLSFVASCICDIGAFSFGKLFGKRKLIEKVSPKKTVAGAVGGICSNAAAFIIFALIAHFCFGREVNYVIFALSGACAALFCEIGDLIASLMKRHFDIKDFSKLIPGHGGFMDRLDSTLLTAPFIYFTYMIFAYFGIQFIK